jgi:drug/metabolite transporter (DMT)-like permease
MGTALLILMVALRPQPLNIPRNAWTSLAFMGFLGVFVHQLLQAFGLRSTSAINTGWLIGLTPLWSAVLSACLHKERFGSVKLLGLLGGFAGAILVVWGGKSGTSLLALPSTKGDFLVLLSTINWAVYSAVGHHTIKRLGAAQATAGAMLCGWLMLLPLFVLNHGWSEWHALSLTGWSAVLFLGIGCSGLGYLFWYGALEKIELSRVAAFLYLEPIVTLATAVALLNEPITAITFIGGLIVLGSVYAVQHAPADRRPAGLRSASAEGR